MHKPSKKPYVSPKLKEHGLVHELTQSGSGHRGKGHMGMPGYHPGMKMSRGRR